MRLYIALVCDPAFARARLQSGSQDERYWSNIGPAMEGAARLRDALWKETDAAIQFAWLVRVDQHMKALRGEEAWALKELSAFWSKAQAAGDDIGWVFYPVAARDDDWVQLHSDDARLAELVAQAHGAYKAAWAAPSGLLMGWYGHTLATMKAASELGVVADFSAIPGWYTISLDGRPSRWGACDWEVTPVTPFHPSTVDYRRPVVYSAETELEILELPQTLARDSHWQLQAAVADLWRPGNLGLRRNQRRRRQGVPIRLDDRAARFTRLAAAAIHAARGQEATLTFVCQATALAPSGSGSRIGRIHRNLSWLAGECRSRKIGLESTTPRQVRKVAVPVTFRLIPIGAAVPRREVSEVR